MIKKIRFLSIVVLIAMLCFIVVGCSNDDSGSGKLSGTYYFTNWLTITFNSNNYTINDGSEYKGTFTVSGNILTLTPPYYGSIWIIANSNTIRDGDGDNWVRFNKGVEIGTIDLESPDNDLQNLNSDLFVCPSPKISSKKGQSKKMSEHD